MLRVSVFFALVLPTACATKSESSGSGRRDTLTVFEAASLATPMRAILDSFARGADSGLLVREEHGASLELARRVTELHRVPDVIAVADAEVFPQLLMPRAAHWYAAFARNRMVVAFTEHSRHAAEMTAATWRSVLLRDDVLLGRTDPVLAPAGYRALLMYQLAERFYNDPGLAARLSGRTPPGLLRGNAAELAALLSAGELDYIVDYESLAKAQHFRYVTLPPDIDLGDATHAAAYATALVWVRRGTDSVEVRGAPILYGISVPTDAASARTAQRFLQYLFGPKGRAMLRAANVDALDAPQVHGDSLDAIPSWLRSMAAP